MAEFKISGGRLSIRGHIGYDDEGEMRDRCRELVTSARGPVVVDLSGVSHVNSMGVGILVSLWLDLGAVSRGGKLIPSPAVLKILELTGLSEVLLKPPVPRGPAEEEPQDSEAEPEGGTEPKGRARKARW